MVPNEDTRPKWAGRVVAAVTVAVVAAASLASCSSGDPEPTALTIVADNDLDAVVHRLAAAYEAANPGTDVRVKIADDGALSQMVESDGTADVVIASDLSVLDTTGSASVFAENPLEIAVTLGNAAGITGLDDFGQAGLAIGLCSEDTPRGEAALQALTAAGVTASVDFTDPDVWEVLSRVETGDLDAAVVWATDVTAEWGYVDVVSIPAEFQAAQPYEIAVLSNSDAVTDAQRLVEYSASIEGRDIIESYGMTAP